MATALPTLTSLRTTLPLLLRLVAKWAVTASLEGWPTYSGPGANTSRNLHTEHETCQLMLNVSLPKACLCSCHKPRHQICNSNPQHSL
jgi:hypothetical protein